MINIEKGPESFYSFNLFKLVISKNSPFNTPGLLKTPSITGPRTQKEHVTTKGPRLCKAVWYKGSRFYTWLILLVIYKHLTYLSITLLPPNLRRQKSSSPEECDINTIIYYNRIRSPLKVIEFIHFGSWNWMYKNQ